MKKRNCHNVHFGEGAANRKKACVLWGVLFFKYKGKHIEKGRVETGEREGGISGWAVKNVCCEGICEGAFKRKNTDILISS